MRRATKVDIHVGKMLRLRRINYGITQKAMAELLGLSAQQIQKYENGTDRITAGKLYEMSKKLDIPIEYFFEDLKNPKKLKANNFEYKDLSKEILRISRLLGKVDDKGKRSTFIRIIEAVLNFGN